MFKFKEAFQQFQYLHFELKRMNNTRWWRWIDCWFSTSFWVIASYRIERSLYLIFGKGWSALRIILSPILFILSPWFGQVEIHYRADISKGLIVLHPSLGVVINGNAIIGENLTLTGGNCIGGRFKLKPGDLVLGNNISLGANAVILGPIKLGDNIQIGAGAVVIDDAPDSSILVGVPAINKVKTIR